MEMSIFWFIALSYVPEIGFKSTSPYAAILLTCGLSTARGGNLSMGCDGSSYMASTL